MYENHEFLISFMALTYFKLWDCLFEDFSQYFQNILSIIYSAKNKWYKLTDRGFSILISNYVFYELLFMVDKFLSF